MSSARLMGWRETDASQDGSRHRVTERARRDRLKSMRQARWSHPLRPVSGAVLTICRLSEDGARWEEMDSGKIKGSLTEDGCLSYKGVVALAGVDPGLWKAEGI